MNELELRNRIAEQLEVAEGIHEAAEAEDRALTDEEQVEWDEAMAEVDELRKRLDRELLVQKRRQEMAQGKGRQSRNGGGRAPAHNKLGADNERNALNHWFRTGDVGGLSHLAVDTEDRSTAIELELPSPRERRAVVDSTMNITTPGDGGNLVPTGFVPRVAQRMSELMLADMLPVQRIQGFETTIDWPISSADPEPFATTAEQTDAHDVAWERHALPVGKKQFTLVVKTREVQVTLQLLRSSGIDLEGFISDEIGKAVALTHNAAAITEILAAGSTLKTFAAAAAIASGEPDDIVYNDTIGYYLEQGSVSDFGWVMRPSTYGDISSITGDNRQYAENPQGSRAQRALLGYPVYWSSQVAAIGASAKSVVFGNFNMLGLYENPSITLQRNPYRTPGLVVFEFHFGLDYGVLQGGALGFGVHPSA